LSLLLLQSYQS